LGAGGIDAARFFDRLRDYKKQSRGLLATFHNGEQMGDTLEAIE